MKYMVADTETCGFEGPDATSSGVVEAAYIVIDEMCGVLSRGSSLICPGRAIGEGAMAVHGITEDMVIGKPTMKQFMAQVIDDEPVVLICHNEPFDRKYWDEHLVIKAGSYCTLAGARQHIKNTSNHKLGTLADELGLTKGDAHRAAGDVVTTLNLLRYILTITQRTLPELVELQRKPVVLTSMPFGEHKGKKFLDVPVDYLRWIERRAADMPADVLFSAKQAINVKGF